MSAADLRPLQHPFLHPGFPDINSSHRAALQFREYGFHRCRQEQKRCPRGKRAYVIYYKISRRTHLCKSERERKCHLFEKMPFSEFSVYSEGGAAPRNNGTCIKTPRQSPGDNSGRASAALAPLPQRALRPEAPFPGEEAVLFRLSRCGDNHTAGRSGSSSPAPPR